MTAPARATKAAAATASLTLLLSLYPPRCTQADESRRREPAPSAADKKAPRADSYEALVALGVAEGRAGHVEEAEKAFQRAVDLAPDRPEAHVEYGGLHFLQGRYDRAVDELRRGLSSRDDAYARGLLATSLHLAGRAEEALDEWNRTGEPVLDSVEFVGLERVNSELVRSELDLPQGQMLTRRQLDISELRLRELGVFSQARLRPVPLGDGTANVEVSLVEKRGFGSPGELVVTSIAYALQERVRLSYTNLTPAALSLGASYRWEATQPEASLNLTWPRPMGLPFHLHMEARQGRPQYELGERVTLRHKGLDLRARRVLGARTVGEAGWLLSRRKLSPGDASDSSLAALQLGVDRSLWESWRHRVDASLRAWGSSSVLGSDIHSYRTLARIKYRVHLSKPEGAAMEPSVLVAQATWGRGGSRIPLDEMFTPGASSDSAYPLRAHLQKRDGVLGRSPIGRSLGLINVEWRRRLWRPAIFSLGGVAFYDGAWPGGTVLPGDSSFHDVGLGLRLAFLSTVLRIDYGRSLTGDGKSALTAGLGHAF